MVLSDSEENVLLMVSQKKNFLIKNLIQSHTIYPQTIGL